MADLASPRYFAIIPAAGESRRMGSPKLLLPLAGKPLISHAIAAWRSAGLAPFVVVRRTDDTLADVCRADGAIVLQPDCDPPEMKHSVRFALEHIVRTSHPNDQDAWLLAPADMPRLSPAIIGKLCTVHAEQLLQPEPAAILIPKLAGQRGHPVLFPWPLAAQVAQLADDEGINALRARNRVREVSCDDLLTADAFIDVDTPADYQRLR